MKSRHLLTSLIVLVFAVSGCRKETLNPNAPSGEALLGDDQSQKPDFTRYIALGNSITSGYSNGGLYLDGQRRAYPNIIAEQMKSVGGGNFFSPYFRLAS